MRCSRWLLAASLGVGVLARLEQNVNQANAVRPNDASGFIEEVREWFEEEIDEFDDLSDDVNDHDKRGLQEENDISEQGNSNQALYDITSSLIQDLEIDAELGYEDIAKAVSQYQELSERQVDPTSTLAPLATDSADDSNPDERDTKPFPPKPEDLVTTIPAHVPFGWTSTSKARINGHRWQWTVQVFATEPTGFAVKYQDHHHHTTVAFGQYDAAQRPQVTILKSLNADRDALDVLKKAQHHNSALAADHAVARDVLAIDELFNSIVAPNLLLQASSSSATTFTTEFQGQPYTVAIAWDSSSVQATAKGDETTVALGGSADLTATPPAMVLTVVSDGETTTTSFPIPSSAIAQVTQVLHLTESLPPTETTMPIAKRIYEELPPRVTPGQVYTHTNVEKGQSTTATIKVTATKPNTGFLINAHSEELTWTIKAHIVKTATPQVIVQTVSGAGVPYVQTDVWGPQKVHAYLPHATPHSTGSKQGASHASKPTSAASPSIHPSNGTLAAPALSTIVMTHIKTTTIRTGGTLTITKTLTADPETSMSGLTAPNLTVTANRQGYQGLFSLPSAKPDAMLQASKCNPALLLKLDMANEEIKFLMTLDLKQLKDHFAHLGWAYIEMLIERVRLLEDMQEKEAAVRAIFCMRHQINDDDTCPCNSRARLDPNATRPVRPMTTEFIARFGPGLSSNSTIIPPARITDGDRTMKFELAKETTKSKSHKSHGKHHSSSTRHTTLALPTDVLGPLQTMTVFLDDVPPATLGMPKCAKEATPNCTRDANGKRNKKECKIEKCMWKFVKPINITTAMPALMTDVVDRTSSVYFDYFTHVTYISGRPHWGTTSTAGLYYPMGYNSTIEDGFCNKTASRERPPKTSTSKKAFPQSMLGRLTEPTIHGDPPCWNKKTCRHLCEVEVKRSNFFGTKTAKVLLGVLAALGGLLLLALLACCCLTLFHRRHKRNKEEREGNSVMGGHAVDPVTGRTVNPATGTDAVTSGSALGPATAAAAAKPGARNAGTLGRQAEEGRGRVHFGDDSTTAAGAGAAGAGAAGGALASEKAAGGEKSGHGGTGITGGGATEAKGTGASGATSEKHAVTSEKIAHEPATHVETVTHHDGAADSRRTGSEMADMGSMRGRRPNRQDDQGLL
ncbi:hypothetical protein PRZ48_000859 [Zasmidium cellare]|uniref:Uncharacterized protein n=1 Tax=Zasmidium cellare TaxID=395010 RepID=A0ABR0F0A4_ZASCE|nr:hypothetical protein PRZ48_000859 [Zasmidium cellare]